MYANRIHRVRNPRRSRTNRSRPQTELLENRRLPSVARVFELDGNAVTTATHDW